MKINLPTEKPGLPSTSAAPASAKNAPATSAKAGPSASQSAQAAGVAVTVSPLARALETNKSDRLPEVDSKKVEAVRVAIAEGTYAVNAEVIADKLLANAQDMLQRSQL